MYVGIAVHEQYSLLDTMFDYICHFGPLGTYLYLSSKIDYLRPTGNRFSRLVYRYVPGGLK